MNTLRSDLLELLEFSDWATRLVHKTVRELTPDQWAEEVGGSFGSIRATMAHMVGAEWIWLERWKGGSPATIPEWLREPEAEQLAVRWEALAAERTDWIAARPEADLRGTLSYSRLGGEPGSNRLDLLVRHVVNHSSYHRGQVAAFLRNLGREPPSTDLVLWDRARGAES